MAGGMLRFNNSEAVTNAAAEASHKQDDTMYNLLGSDICNCGNTLVTNLVCRKCLRSLANNLTKLQLYLYLAALTNFDLG